MHYCTTIDGEIKMMVPMISRSLVTRKTPAKAARRWTCRDMLFVAWCACLPPSLRDTELYFLVYAEVVLSSAVDENRMRDLFIASPAL